MRHQYKHIGGRDLSFEIKCKCPSKLFEGSDVAHLFKEKIRLSGYADDNFFDNVNKEPREIQCQCGRKYSVRWFRDGVEYSEVA